MCIRDSSSSSINCGINTSSNNRNITSSSGSRSSGSSRINNSRAAFMETAAVAVAAAVAAAATATETAAVSAVAAEVALAAVSSAAEGQTNEEGSGRHLEDIQQEAKQGARCMARASLRTGSSCVSLYASIPFDRFCHGRLLRNLLSLRKPLCTSLLVRGPYILPVLSPSLYPFLVAYLSLIHI